MNDEKKEKLKKSLEEIKEKIKELDNNIKSEEMEQFIDKLTNMIEAEPQGFTFKFFMNFLYKIFIMLMLFYILFLISIGTFFGFFPSLLNEENSRMSLIVLLLISPIVLFILLRIENLLLNRYSDIELLIMLFFYNGLIAIFLATIDQLFLHISLTYGSSLIIFTAIMLLANFLDIYVAKKIYFSKVGYLK